MIQGLSHTNPKVYGAAVVATSNILNTEEDCVLDRFATEGYLDKIGLLLTSPDANIHRLCLWGVSNLVTKESHVIAFFSNERIVNRVMVMMKLSQDFIRSEAGFVMSNALTSCEAQTLKIIFDNHKGDLIEGVLWCLRSTAKSNIKLRMNLLRAISALLELDH